jgi:hypothetical protein
MSSRERNKIKKEIQEFVLNFDKICEENVQKRGIYIYGPHGCGKTHFVEKLLTEIDYDIIKYDAGDSRNKHLVESLNSDNISTKNVMSMFKKKESKIAIIMDEIDGMNSNDKSGLSSLIKLIRQKKTKKQRLESKTNIPIICIGNTFNDKKIRELMNICNVYELKSPSNKQIKSFLKKEMKNYENLNDKMEKCMVDFIQGDLRKMTKFKELYENNTQLMNEEYFLKIFQKKHYNDDAKKITHELIYKRVNIEDHNIYMNDTERTIVALLWHENIVDKLKNVKLSKSLPFYYKVLDNICYADYIDRVTFQNQIWQLNEMTSLLKTFYNNKIYHDTFKPKYKHYEDIRFTKVLTKYSTEYNNNMFINGLCQILDMERSDVLCFFQEIRQLQQHNPDIYNEIESNLIENNINKLDIRRIYRYLNKNASPILE